MADPGYSSIDAQLSHLSLHENSLQASLNSNNNNNASADAKNPALLKKKRPARAYHVLSPAINQSQSSSLFNVSPVGTPPPPGAGMLQTSLISASHQFSPNNLSGQQPQQQQLYYNNNENNSSSRLYNPGSPLNASTASISAKTVPYPSGSHSNPISPFSPPAPSSLQFQYQSEIQNKGQFGNRNNNQRVVSREITSNIPELYSGKPYQPDSSLSVPDQRDYFQNEFWSNEFLTFQNACPPIVTTDFRVVDQGTASPKFMTLSMYNIPATDHLRTISKLPVALNVRPFAPVEEDGDEPVPEVSFPNGPLRCNRCRAYINSTVQFTHSNKFICNLCQFANPIPEEYASPLDQNFRRIDHLQRPELNKGVVDFTLPKQYWEKDSLEPIPLHQVFLIDVSIQALQKEIPRLVCDAIRASLYSFSEEGEEVCLLPPGSKVSIITFDKNIQFYNLNASLQQPLATIMTDIGDPFIPFFEGLFVDPIESKLIIEETLTLIESTHKFNRSSEVSYGAALTTASIALEEFTGGQGGKISCTLSTIPNFGPGMLSLKKYEGVNLSKDSEKEKLVLDANNSFYKDLLKTFVTKSVGLDLFVFPSFEMDLINTSYVTSHTGGALKLYNAFNPIRDERKFIFDFKKSIGDTVGYQGHLKVRCSSGLQVQEYYGNFNDVVKNTQDPIVPLFTKNSNFTVLFNYDGKLNTKLDCHFQAAVLYTTVSGIRKVRVINLVAAVTDRLVDVFSFVNQDVLLNLMVRDCVKHIPEQSLVSIKQLVDDKLVNIFTQYRHYIASKQALPSQFIVPEGLKTLSSYLLSFEKSRLLKVIASLTKNNLRIQNMHNLYNVPLPVLSYFLYPFIVPLHNLNEDDCEYNEIYNKYRLPKGVSASLSSIDVGGCYFAFNGQQALVWIHKEVNPLLLKDLFGVESVDKVDPLLDEFPYGLNTDISKQAQNLVDYFAKKVLRTEFLPIKVLRFGMDDQLDFLELFIEDKSIDGIASYGDYLSLIHKKIREKTEKLNGSASSGSSKSDFFPKLGGLVS